MGIANKKEQNGRNISFAIKDCALVAMATGKKARNLPGMRSELKTIPPASIYHHFWGGLLEPRFEEREYNNDFASWVRHGIHDAILAERLAALDPTVVTDTEALRHEMIELIETRLDEAEYLHWTGASHQFEFICSQIVVFDTKRSFEKPVDLAMAISGLSTSSIFYHFIDARRRTANRKDDFSEWLGDCGAGLAPLLGELANVDPWFTSLTELRGELSRVFENFFPEAA